MTPQEALNLVDNGCSQLKLSREEHERVRTAIQVLQFVVTPPKIEPLEKDEKK